MLGYLKKPYPIYFRNLIKFCNFYHVFGEKRGIEGRLLAFGVLKIEEVANKLHYC